VSSVTVTRPIWRRFWHAYRGDALAFVRQGGHAAIVFANDRVEALVGLDRAGKLTELAEWALLAIEQRRWKRVLDGAAVSTVASARVKPEYAEAVLDWCDRDAVYPGPTRRITLDCLRCAACCQDMNVVLGAADVRRWTAAGRSDLHGRAYVRRKRDGRLVLRLHDSGRCLHLRRDKLCRVYEMRPDNCRAFVIGSEACLAAREDTLGLRDG